MIRPLELVRLEVLTTKASTLQAIRASLLATAIAITVMVQLLLGGLI